MGYLHPLYAQSLVEFGTPQLLEQSGGWILLRQIPSSSHSDAMGCYPIFCCNDWSQLEADLVDLESELVTLALVTDPFGSYEPEDLEQVFDVILKFKEHFVVDLQGDSETCINKHHLYYARKALKETRVDICERPMEYLEEWTRLYDGLIKRHSLQGLKAFSRKAFEKQLAIPGSVLLKATHGDKLVGAHLWFVHENVAYSHLTAMNETGYKLSVSYGLHEEALRMFKEQYSEKIRYVDLGAGAGVDTNSGDGLTKFKRGWSNSTRPVYFCGRILNAEHYEEISRMKELNKTDYFPAYRQGEFG